MALDRFKTAQAARAAGFDTALAELRAGRKTSHWIWYVFPQLAGLGHSTMARTYALRDLDEACDYLRDPLLRERLMRAAGVVAQQLDGGVRLAELMGGEIDALKLVSSLTLFELAARRLGEGGEATAGPIAELCAKILTQAGAQGLPRCSTTLTQAR